MSSTISVADQIGEILDEYMDDVKDATEKAMSKVAREGAKTLRSTSPRKTGDYGRGWAVKRENGFMGIPSFIIHNKTDWQLTHLLEFGHVIRNKYGTYGRAPAYPHIKPVETWAQDELPEEIKRRLEK